MNQNYGLSGMASFMEEEERSPFFVQVKTDGTAFVMATPCRLQEKKKNLTLLVGSLWSAQMHTGGLYWLKCCVIVPAMYVW